MGRFMEVFVHHQLYIWKLLGIFLAIVQILPTLKERMREIQLAAANINEKKKKNTLNFYEKFTEL